MSSFLSVMMKKTSRPLITRFPLLPRRKSYIRIMSLQSRRPHLFSFCKNNLGFFILRKRIHLLIFSRGGAVYVMTGRHTLSSSAVQALVRSFPPALLRLGEVGLRACISDDLSPDLCPRSFVAYRSLQRHADVHGSIHRGGESTSLPRWISSILESPTE